MEVWKDQLLLAEGTWDDVGEAAKSVQTQLVKSLIRQRAVPCELGIAYWSAVPASTASILLFYIQQLPLWLVETLKRAWRNAKLGSSGNVVGSGDSATVSSGRLTSPGLPSLQSLETRWRALRNFGVTNAGLRPYIVGRYRAIRAIGSHFAREASTKHVKTLKLEQQATAEQIGRLICADREVPAEFVAQLVSVVSPTTAASSGKMCDTPELALQQLQQVLDSHPPAASTGIPKFVVRWWPAAAVGAIALWKLTGSWTSVVAWLQSSVVDTVQSFYRNWIVDPLLQIYKTIRHDPTQQVALVAKDSLAADATSLERMVVDFARDTEPSLTNAELETIRRNAARGDLTPVLAVYERQIGSPVLSIVTGKLIRTLLIQVQKGKVDLEVALSGIDQLLQSQQLVFGLVAAIPAIGVLWWLTRLVGRQLVRQVYGSEAANARSERSQVIAGLSTVDSIAQQAAGAELSYAEVGLIFTQIAMIRHALRSKSVGSQQLGKVLDRLLKHTVERNSTAVLTDLDRAFMRYQLQ